MGVTPNWVVGVGGYAYWQTTDDFQNGDRIHNNRGRSFAIGPAVKYTSSDGWFFSLKWQKESNVRNKPEGEAMWLKLTVPL
ncbi:transporter [Azotobacter vinelandii]|uniref:transporter n=1 Tax=Azotobacter vinelandii TaxID=354 RepID=UPI00345DE542